MLSLLFCSSRNFSLNKKYIYYKSSQQKYEETDHAVLGILQPQPHIHCLPLSALFELFLCRITEFSGLIWPLLYGKPRPG